jgi:hypothetical protein
MSHISLSLRRANVQTLSLLCRVEPNESILFGWPVTMTVMIAARANKAKNQASLQQAHRTIRSLYLLKNLVLSEDRDLFYDDVAAHLQQPLRELNAWFYSPRTTSIGVIQPSTGSNMSPTRTLLFLLWRIVFDWKWTNLLIT